MALLEPVTGYPFAPEGIAHLDLNGEGNTSFSLDGAVHMDNGAYIGPGVVARGVTLDARVTADRLAAAYYRHRGAFRQGGADGRERRSEELAASDPGATRPPAAPPSRAIGLQPSNQDRDWPVAIRLQPPTGHHSWVDRRCRPTPGNESYARTRFSTW